MVKNIHYSLFTIHYSLFTIILKEREKDKPGNGFTNIKNETLTQKRSN